MSHFTYIKTRFQNLFYLEKALHKLNLMKLDDVPNNLNIVNEDLIIPQKNGHEIKFIWNGSEYELLTDLSFWNQSYPVESFMDRLTQQYTCELVIGESQKIGFEPVNDIVNNDGSTTLALERWNISR